MIFPKCQKIVLELKVLSNSKENKLSFQQILSYLKNQKPQIDFKMRKLGMTKIQNQLLLKI